MIALPPILSVTVAGVTGTAYCALEYTDASSGDRTRTAPQKVDQNDQTVTFREKWNQLLKPGEELTILLGATEKEIKDGSPIRYSSMLTVQCGPVDKPLFDTTGAFANAFNPLGSGFLSCTLPSGSNIPGFLADSTVSLDLPFCKYFPRLIINVDGSFSFSAGGQIDSLNPDDMVDANGEKVSRWKTQDQRDLEKRTKERVEQGAKLNYLAKAGAMWDGCKSFRFQLLGKSNASVSTFMYLYGRYQHDADGYGSVKANGGMGISLTFSSEIMMTFGPIFTNVGLTASLAVANQIGMMLDTYWPDGGILQFGKFQWLSEKTGITNQLRLQVDVSVGAGIKGLLSISAHGYGYINILLGLLGKVGEGELVTISARVGFYVLVQVFWLKWKKPLFDLGERVLYTNQKQTADNSMLRILEPFLPSAVAENSGEAQETVSLTPASYPNLEISNAKAVFSSASFATDNVKILTLNSKDYAFYLEKGRNGVRLKWLYLDGSGESGDLIPPTYADILAPYSDYDFAVDTVSTYRGFQWK